jgi:hypothetical protein
MKLKTKTELEADCYFYAIALISDGACTRQELEEYFLSAFSACFKGTMFYSYRILNLLALLLNSMERVGDEIDRCTGKGDLEGAAAYRADFQHHILLLNFVEKTLRRKGVVYRDDINRSVLRLRTLASTQCVKTLASTRL